MADRVKINDLLKQLYDAKKEQYDFHDMVELNSCLTRKLIIREIDEFTGSSVGQYIQFYNELDEQNEIPVEERIPIKIYLDSPGGDMSSTFTAIDSIRMSKTPIWTINIGMSYSGGFFIFIAGHKRFAYNLSSFLFHEGATMAGGDAGKFRNYTDFYKKQLEKLKNLTLDYTKITDEQYEKHINDDWWIDAAEALELGICDEIINELIY